MATLLDAGLFGFFNSFFVFLFVLVAVYAFLTTVRIFGENATINGIISFILAILFASSSYATKIFQYAAPWLVLLFIIIIFLELTTKFMGSEKIFSVATNTSLVTIVIILVIVIFAISAGQVSKEKKETLIEQGLIEEGENPILSFPQKIGETLRQPAILGLVAVFLIATFAIMLLTRPDK